MAKESTSSRIPRLDGASRIPMPGSLRPPSSNVAIANRGAPAMCAANSTAFPHKRPTTLAGLRPSIAGVNTLKRSSSGDHITNAISLVTKKTASAFKMLMSRPEAKSQPPPTNQTKTAECKMKEKSTMSTPPLANGGAVAPSLTASTPRTLTRSDTFVRTDSPSDISLITPHISTQSTPAQSTAATAATTATAMNATFQKPTALETTQLLSGKTRHVLYTNPTQCSAANRTVTKPSESFDGKRKDSTQQRKLTLEQTHTICSEDLEQTLVNSTINSTVANSTQIVLKPNLMTTFNVISPPLVRKQQQQQQTFVLPHSADHTITLQPKQLTDQTKVIDSVDAVSPVTNATYSNPGSVESLQMLEDVSVPSGFDMDVTLQSDAIELEQACAEAEDVMDATLLALAPDKAHMKLALNSTVNTERLLDLTSNMLSPTKQMNLFNLSPDYTINKPPHFQNVKNTSQLLYMTQLHSASASTTPETNTKFGAGLKNSPLCAHTNNSPALLLKGAQSDLVLPTRTPDEELVSKPMDVDAATLLAMGARTEEFYAGQSSAQQQPESVTMSLQDVNNPNAKQKARFSFGLDLTESTLDCSIELIDVSLSSTAMSQPNTNSSVLPQSPCSQTQSQQQLQQQLLKKQNSFELDESLGILTPDQMKEFLDSTNTNNTNNLELPLALSGNASNKMSLQQMRIDQTPSPEELPLDPIEVKTDISDIVLQHQHQQQQQQQQQHALFSAAAAQQQRQQMQQQHLQSSSISTEPVSTHTDTELSKTSDQMSKSNVSKISTSFITSVTSVTSLDTGYQGDGEMSRPASRGASDHSPSNGPMARKGGHVSRQPSFHQQQQQQMPLVRRQDPMTDSDFFTESDADDIFHRGDRRAQVIDGQLYGPMLQQPAASVFISEDPEDSCMESSGIFTDVENRCDEDLAQMRRQDTQEAMGDISPEGDADDSTETVKSNRAENSKRANTTHGQEHAATDACSNVDAASALHANAALGQGQLSNSPTSSTIQSSMSNDRLSAATLSNRTSYCSVDGSTVNVDCKSFSSLEEAFVECATAGDLNSHVNNNTSPNTNASANAKRTKNSTTGNAAAADGSNSDVGAGASGSCREEPHSVQRVIPPRKHASLNSLCAAVNGVFGAKTETKSSPLKTVNAAERDTCSESGTRGTKVSPSPSPTSSTSSLSLGDNSAHVKSINSSCASVAGKRTPRGKNNTKHPTKHRISSACGASANRLSAGTKVAPNVARKSRTPSKWEAVMHKIESNKTLPKRNYDAVKSKVSTTRPPNAAVGVSANNRSSASTPLVRRSPTNTNTTTPNTNNATATSPSSATHSGGQVSPRVTAPLLQQRPTDTGAHAAAGGGAQQSLQAQTTKRLLQGVAAKRGRSYSKDSKDSQKSSQSDLSLASAGGGGGGGGAGSPKLLAKTPLRAAKKRDVRNLSISPTDLGPPPKAQQTAKGTSTRTKSAAISLTQKRFSPQSVSGSQSPTATAVNHTTGSGTSVKGKVSPIVKKQHSIFSSKRLETNQPAKAPLKEQNRIIGSSQSIATTPAGNKNASKPETPTELRELHHNNNNITTITATSTVGNGTSTGTATAHHPTRHNSQTPSPILGHHGKKTAAVVAATVLLEKKTQSKLQSSRSKALQSKQQQQKQHSIDDVLPSQATAEYLDAAELQRLKRLNRHSCNGRLNYEALERHLEQAELRQEHHDKSVKALGVLLQYLVYDLDAFACPVVKNEREELKGSLVKTVQLLEDAKSTCTQLHEQICDKEAYYTQREEELQALHRCELEKAQTNLSEYQTYAKAKIETLEAMLVAKDEEHKRKLDSYRMEMENKFSQQQQRLTAVEASERDLKERLSALQLSEQALHEKLTQTESAYAAHIQSASERENTLNERIKTLSKELDVLRESKEHNERELRDKLNLSQDEIAVLRTSRKSCSESFTERSSTSLNSPRNSSTSSVANSLEITRLQSEADSLRCVLELKQKELSKLAKHNEELLRDADERVALQGKISLLESRNEMLQSELEIKSEKEKDYLRQIEDIQKAYNHETVKRTRLSYDNEALQWQLKQRSEQLHIVEAKLQELSAHESLNASSLNSSGLNRTALLNGTSSLQMEDISPPTSPVIKGVIEKPDSVSWVLEMDDETPEAAASKMVKRAGSFRSVERSPSTRRQLSVSTSAVSTSLNSSGSGLTGPNPLSQSMSATSVIRQHSSDAGHEFGNRSHARIRSKSVSVKSTEPNSSSRSGKKLVRQHSTSSTKKQHHQLELGNWQEPIGASSPYCGDGRARTSTMCGGDSAASAADRDEVLYRRGLAATSGNRKLITCDTSALNSGERLEMHSLPTHTSVHDLKVLKKCQEIQESAGEAMVSGTNSEDEGCSASSDEIVCSASTSSGTTGSTSSINQMKNSHMSLEEEELLLEKINSLNGTPMEVSWSDDADVFANGSTV